MTTNSQLSTMEPKNKNKNKVIEQLEQELELESQIWRLQGWLSVGRGLGENGGKGTGNKHKQYVQNRVRLRIVLEMEKAKNLYVQPMDIN